jgi:uncharacterized membrane protein YhaH (DUF805 family)
VKSLAHLLIGFEGSIRRSDYWLALCILIVVTPSVMFAVEPGYLRRRQATASPRSNRADLRGPLTCRAMPDS